MFNKKKIKYLETRLNEIHEDYQQKLLEMVEEHAKDYTELKNQIIDIEHTQQAITELFTNQVTERMDSVESAIKYNINEIYKRIDIIDGQLSVCRKKDKKSDFLGHCNSITLIGVPSSVAYISKDRLDLSKLIFNMPGRSIYLIKTDYFDIVTRENSIRLVRDGLICKQLTDMGIEFSMKRSYQSEALNALEHGALPIDKDFNHLRIEVQ